MQIVLTLDHSIDLETAKEMADGFLAEPWCFEAEVIAKHCGKCNNISILADVKILCDLIVNSPPETTIKGKIESMALNINHDPSMLNFQRLG